MKYFLLSLLTFALASEPIYVTIMVVDGYARFAYSSENNGRLSVDVEKQGDYYQAPPFAIKIKPSGKILFWDARDPDQKKHVIKTMLNVRYQNQAIFEVLDPTDAQKMIWLIREIERQRTRDQADTKPYQLTYRDHAIIALEQEDELGIIYIPGNYATNDLGDLVWIDDVNQAHHIPVFSDSTLSRRAEEVGLLRNIYEAQHPIHFPDVTEYVVACFSDPEPAIHLPDDGRPRPDSLHWKRVGRTSKGWYVRDTTHHSVAGEVRYILHR